MIICKFDLIIFEFVSNEYLELDHLSKNIIHTHKKIKFFTLLKTYFTLHTLYNHSPKIFYTPNQARKKFILPKILHTLFNKALKNFIFPKILHTLFNKALKNFILPKILYTPFKKAHKTSIKHLLLNITTSHTKFYKTLYNLSIPHMKTY